MTFVYPKQNKYDNSTEAAYIQFGATPDGVINGNTVTHSVVKKENSFWNLALNGMRVNDTKFDLESEYVMPDTGT